MVNKVILIGHLGRDPEVRSAASGKPVANLSIATNRRWKGAEGQRQEATEWHHVVLFGRLAEVAGEYLRRGRQVYVRGPHPDPLLGGPGNGREAATAPKSSARISRCSASGNGAAPAAGTPQVVGLRARVDDIAP